MKSPQLLPTIQLLSHFNQEDDMIHPSTSLPDSSIQTIDLSLKSSSPKPLEPPLQPIKSIDIKVDESRTNSFSRSKIKLDKELKSFDFFF